MATGGEVPGQLPDSGGSEHQGQRVCRPCMDKDNLILAIGLCVDCKDYLCLKCFNDHKVQQHRVLDREHTLHGDTKINPDDSCSDQCSVHRNEVIQYYCASHCHLGCKSCINLDHAECDEVQYIPRLSKELKNNEDYRQVEIRLKSVLDTFINVFHNAQRNSEETDKSCGDALRELNDFKRQIREILEKIERELIKKVQGLRLKAEQELAEMRNKYKEVHEELQSSLAKIEALQNDGQNCSSYIEMMRTKEKIISLEDQTQQAEVDKSYRQSPVQFYPNMKLQEILTNLGGFGTVSSVGSRTLLSGSDEVITLSDTDKGSVITQSDDITILSHETAPSFSDDFSVISDPESGTIQAWLRTLPNPSGSDTGDVPPESAFGTRDYHVQSINVKTERDKCWITGMVVLPDSRLMLTDHTNGCVKVVDVQTGQVVVQQDLVARPWDITFTEQNKVAVTIPYSKIVACFTVGNNILRIDRELTVGGTCYGVDYRNGKLAVSYCDPHKVQIISLQGHVLHNIASDKPGKALFNNPYYLTFGQDDTTLYVSNHSDYNVVCVKVGGTIVATYRDKDLRYPLKAVMDSSGNVYVCSLGSNSVHLITKDCKKLQVLLTQADGLDKPFSLCLSEEEDKMYVGMLGSEDVKVYRAGCNESQ